MIRGGLSLARLARVREVDQLAVRFMCMWPPRFEDPITDLQEIKDLKNTTDYSRKAAVPIKAARKDLSLTYFQDPLIQKFTKMVQVHSQAYLGEQIMMKVYNKIKEIQLKKGRANVETDPTIIIKQAIENCRPVMRLEKVKVGAVIYMVPTPITETRSYFEGMRWIHHTARDERKNPRIIQMRKFPDEPVPPRTTIWDALASELLEAYSSQGRAFNKKVEYHRVCEQNRAYAHYRRTK